jgi:threonine dehydratase
MDMDMVYAAQKRLQPYLFMTPLLYSPLLNRQLKKHVWLKLETQLPTGTFKPRPAFNSILSHLDEAHIHGIIACSSGNFAQGVAYAAHELGISAIIVMAKTASPYKIERTRSLGAEVILHGDTYQESVVYTMQLQKETKRVLIEPYDSIETVAGDATIGVELSKQLGEKLDNDVTILVAASGGGLLAGVAFALKNLHPSCKIIGIQPKNNGSMAESFNARKCVRASNPKPSIADALGAPIPGEIPFNIIRDYVDDVVLVTEEELQFATNFFLEQHKLVVEPSGASPVAALFANKIAAKNVICITSGGNIPLQIGR